MHLICQMYGYWISGQNMRDVLQSPYRSHHKTLLKNLHLCAELIVSSYPLITRSPDLTIMSHITTRMKLKGPSEVAFFFTVCRTSKNVLFYGEIKENHGGYLQLSWHSKSEHGVDGSPLIEDTFERCEHCVPNGEGGGVPVTWHSWCNRDLQWCTENILQPVRHDAEHTSVTEWSSEHMRS